MRLSNFILALVGITSALAIQFGGRTLPGCSNGCYNQILGQPGLKGCPPSDVLCLCNDYAILTYMQDCLNRTNNCANDRVDAIQDIQDVCDEAILNAAKPSSTAVASPTDNGDDPIASNTGTPATNNNNTPEPTSLEEAEARLGKDAQAMINEKPFQLSTAQKAGIAIGSIVGFLLLCFIGFCCGVFHYKKYVIRKMNEDLANSPTVRFPGDEDDKQNRSSWFTNSTGFKSHSRGATNDSHELGYGLDKELGLMISAPTNPRKFTTTKMRTVDIPESAHTMPRVPPPAVSPHRNPMSPTLSRSSRTISLGRVEAPQRPSLTLSSPTLVLPQATIDDYTPRNSVRVSVQSVQQRPQTGPNINIPLMFFTPATPQMNTSPISPSASSANGDIYNYYSRDSIGKEDNTIGIARTSIDERTTPSPQPYDPTNNDYIRRTPSPAYTPYASQASPYNNYSQFPESRNGTPGFDHSSDASSRISSPSPVGAGLHMPPRYAPYSSTAPQSINSSSPAPSEASQSQISSPPPVPPKVMPEMVDLSSMPATISRANSTAWRLSVERAADRAMDKVRTATSHSDDIPEEEERLTKSELPNTMEDAGRGRRKRRNYSKESNNYMATRTSKSEKRRSGSMGVSPNGSYRRTPNTSAGGYARRSSSLGGYRNRTGSLSYNQIDGIPRVPRRNSRRGSNSSSVMMI